MATTHQQELTEANVEDFIGFVSFVAKNDLFDDAREALEKAGVTTIHVSTEPIQVIRRLIDEDLLPNKRLDAGGHKHAVVISECSCGSTPTTAPPDGGTEGGLVHPMQEGTSQ